MMDPNILFGAVATVSIVAAILAVTLVARISARAQAADIWRGEAEAWQARAERQGAELAEIKDRLTALEAENRALIELITSLSPGALRPSTTT